MDKIVDSIVNTQIPTIFVIVGILLLFLAIGIQFNTKIITTNVKPSYARNLGSIFLMLGLILHISPGLITYYKSNQLQVSEDTIKKSKLIIKDALCIKNITKKDIIFDFSWGGGRNKKPWHVEKIKSKEVKRFIYQGEYKMVIKTPSAQSSERQKRAVLTKLLLHQDPCNEETNYIFSISKNIPVITNAEIGNRK